MEGLRNGECRDVEEETVFLEKCGERHFVWSNLNGLRLKLIIVVYWITYSERTNLQILTTSKYWPF